MLNYINKYRLIFFSVTLLLFVSESSGQVVDSTTYFAPITIDEVIVNSSRNGFDINGFIERIKNDTTFYKAFRSMHLATYNADNSILVFEKKKDKVKASLKSETKQIYRDGCRTMNVLEEQTTGNFYDKKGNYNYYTAELYASLFFTKGKVCNEDNIVKGKLDADDARGTLEKNKAKLKQLMFNPGSKISGIPFMGDRSAIFDPDIAKMYDFKLTTGEKNGTECYVFEATPKKGFEGETVYKQFKTWFRNTDFAIISRDYALAYSTFAYDFDVKIHVDLTEKNKVLLPAYISYRGNWFAFTKGREKVTFTAKFEY